MIDGPQQALPGGRVGRIEQPGLDGGRRHQVEEHYPCLLVAEPRAPDRRQRTQRRAGELAGVGRGYRQLEGLASTVLRIVGPEAIGLDEHDEVCRRQPLPPHLLRRPRGVGRDGLGHLG